MTIDYPSRHPSLSFDRPAAGVLRITLDAPGLNAVTGERHRDLAEVWATIDRDPDVRVAMIRGAGKGFSAGGSFELVEAMIDDYAVRTRVLREARDLVRNVIDCAKPIVSAIHGPAVGAGLARACARPPDHTRPPRRRCPRGTGTTNVPSNPLPPQIDA